MRRALSSLAALGLLAGCATTYSGDPSPSAESALFPVHTPPVVAEPTEPAAPAPASPAFELAPLTLTNAATLDSLPRYEDRSSDDRNNYLTAKLGEIYPSESSLNSGWLLGAAYGRYFTRLFSLELAGSYYEPDPDFATSNGSYAVPLMLNARVNLPLWVLEIYGGAGIGAVYYNIDGGSLDGDGWLAAGNVFVGADLTVFDRLSAGVELRYFITDDIRNSSINLDAVAIALTLGFRF